MSCSLLFRFSSSPLLSTSLIIILDFKWYATKRKSRRERKFFDIMRKYWDKQHTTALQRTQHDIVSFLLTCSVNLWWHGCLMLSLTLKCLSPITSSSFSMCHNGWSRGMFPFVAVFSWEIPCAQSFVYVDLLHLMFTCCHTTYSLNYQHQAKCVNLIFSVVLREFHWN